MPSGRDPSGTPPETPHSSPPVHASCVAHRGQGVLITGASGSGKSGLALQLMALGADLVADDRTQLWRDGDQVMADAPLAIRGQIEARYIGILSAKPAGPVPLALVIDMDAVEETRLPPRHERSVLGCDFPLFIKSDVPHFPAAILTYLSGGRVA